MLSRRQKRIRRVTVVGLALVVSLCPLPIRDVDRARAVEKACTALLDGRRVWVDWRYVPLPGHKCIVEAKARYFVNSTNIDDEVFIRLGLKSMTAEAYASDGFYESGNVRIWAGFDSKTVSTDVCLGYVFGDRGVQMLRLALYRNVFGVFVHYRDEWYR